MWKEEGKEIGTNFYEKITADKCLESDIRSSQEIYNFIL